MDRPARKAGGLAEGEPTARRARDLRVAALAVGLGVAHVAVACGAGRVADAPRTVVAPPVTTATDASVDGPSEPLPSVESLAAEASRVAPGLRELMRGAANDGAPSREIVRAAKDMCVRIVYAADVPVRARVESSGSGSRDGGVTVLFPSAVAPSAPSKSKVGALGASGPVCVRSGDAVTLVFEADGPFHAVFVAWGSP